MADRPRSGVLVKREPERIWDLKPGEWRPLKTHGKEGNTHVALGCPWCGTVATSSKHRHEFFADGTFSVTPSFVCPQPGCGWHVFIAQSAWTQV